METTAHKTVEINGCDFPIVFGRQYMVRRFADSRRVRVEVTRVMQFEGVRTVSVFGKWCRADRQGRTSAIVVSDERAWSTEPQLIEEVDQI